MLKVNSTSPAISSKRDSPQKRLVDALESQRYKIECYKAWIKALAPEESHRIIQEVEERLADRG